MKQQLSKARIQELIETLDTLIVDSYGYHNGYEDKYLVYAINIFLQFILDKKYSKQSPTSSSEEMISGAKELGSDISKLVKKHTGLDKKEIKIILTKLKE